MRLTKKMTDVVACAFALGYKVENHPTRVEVINPIKGRPGLVLCEDGTAYRNDVSLELATTIRTAKQMKDVLISGAKLRAL